MRKRIIIIGPNGVGKTKIAFELARQNSGEIINLDRTYLYRGFPVTTGLQDSLSERAVRMHLYELLEPHEESYSAKEFVGMVESQSLEVLKTANIAIAEGASTVYVPALLEKNSRRKIFDCVIGLRCSDESAIESKYRQRIDLAFFDGVLELKTNLHRYLNSYLIKECHFAVPTMKYMRGELTEEEAKSEILQRCLDYKDRQLKLFSRFSEIEWVESTNFADTYHEVERIVGGITPKQSRYGA